MSAGTGANASGRGPGSTEVVTDEPFERPRACFEVGRVDASPFWGGLPGMLCDRTLTDAVLGALSWIGNRYTKSGRRAISSAKLRSKTAYHVRQRTKNPCCHSFAHIGQGQHGMPPCLADIYSREGPNISRLDDIGIVSMLQQRIQARLLVHIWVSILSLRLSINASLSVLLAI